MKKFFVNIFLLIFILIGFIYANSDGNIKWDDDPKKIIDTIKSDTQNTKLDSGVSGGGVKATLENVSKNIIPYIKWIIFIGLSVGTILIILNGIFLMKDSSVGNGPDINKFRTRMLNIVIGVFLLTGFAIIINIFVSILNSIFK